MSIIANTAVSFVVLSAITGAHIIANAATYQPLSSQPTTSISKPKATPAVVLASKAVTPAAPAPTPAPVVVTVQSGDTLSSIAENNGTSYTRLFDANADISDPNIITVGQQITIPSADAQLTDRPLPAAAVVPASTPTSAAPVKAASATVTTASYPVSNDAAKAFIYSRESGNNPNATNPAGCYGLGQDCNGVVRSQCGADYACQDAFFTNYATSRYGSWAGAESFWLANGWW
jgi:LysM repeat protein